MIIIVESGATKSDWRVLDDAGVQVERRLLQGTNVSSMNIEKVKEVLAEGLKEVGAVENDSLYLYTAGVMTDSIRRELTDFVLSQVRLSDIDIQNDLIGAARGALGHRTGVAAIMGTGSNACFYDGKAVSQKVFSGGFILGDNGSASALGKLFLTDYIKNLIPEDVAKAFEAQFDASYGGIVENVYRSTSPAGYLGSLAPFIMSHYDNPYIKGMVDRNFQDFIDRSLKCYDTSVYPVGIVGGFGYACRDIFMSLCEKSGIEVAGFVKEPIEGLIRYHIESITSNYNHMKVNTNSRFYKWEIIILLWIAYFLNQGDRQVFNTVLPHIQEFLGVSDGTMGFISTCFNLFFACTVPFAGYFADRLPRRKIIIFSVALFSTATMFTGLANTVILMILLRSVATGMGEAMFGPTYPAMIAEYHNTDTRARAMSIHQTAYYIGVIASGFLAGLIADKLGWQYSFLIFGAAGVIFTFVLLLRLKDKKEQQDAAAVQVRKPSFFEAMSAIFKVPTAVCMIVGFTSLIFVLTGYLTWMPKYLMETFDLTAASAGFNSMFWTHAAAFVGVLIAGGLSDRVAVGKGGGKNRLLLQASGLILAAPCIVLMGMSESFVIVYAALAGFGFFRAFFDANTYSILYDVIPVKYHSSSSAVLQMFGFGMGSLAPLILGLMSPVMGLSGGIASLSIIWVLAGIVLLAARFFFYDRDAAKLKKE